jgi:hypothetical protein
MEARAGQEQDVTSQTAYILTNIFIANPEKNLYNTLLLWSCMKCGKVCRVLLSTLCRIRKWDVSWSL